MKRNNRSRRIKRIIFGCLLVLLILASVWGVRWATFARQPLPEVVEALVSDDHVQVSSDPWLSFSPVRDKPSTGLIFYPGGRIDPRGYASLMRQFADEGYLVIVPEMPLNMAPFNVNIAEDIQAYYPDIENWAIGGHSVGGTMAAQYTDNHIEDIDGLILWASYPANNADLSDLSLSVTLVYGSMDPRVDAESVTKRRKLLPQHSQYIEIEGGDHHQFGAYEITPEEHFATTSQTEQHNQIIQATLALLSEIQD